MCINIFKNATVNYLHLLLMPLFTCFGIKNEPANSCVLWKIYKCYLKLLIDVMLINVKSQINSILNRWVLYSSLLFIQCPYISRLEKRRLDYAHYFSRIYAEDGFLLLCILKAMQENCLILLENSCFLCHISWR